MPVRLWSFSLVAGVVLACLARCAVGGSATGDPALDYAPDAEIEQTIQQLTLPDKLGAQNAWERLAGLGGAAERALQWHLFRERDLSAKVRWAEFLSRMGRGKVGYRVTVELQPDGSGLLSLWSDRVFLAECAKRYDRLQGKRERAFSDEELRRNVYSKAELFDCLNDGVKPQEARVESREDAVEAYGLLSFKNFDALAAFAEKFDTGGYYMLGGATLTDAASGTGTAGGMRTYRFRKAREAQREQYERNMLLFYNVQWEFVLDFKGAIRSSNAPKTDASKLVWNFTCLQMVSGQVLVEAGFDAKGLAPRPPTKEDRALPIPAVAQANQPIAIVRQDTVKAKVYKGEPGEKLVYRTLRERGELVELDARDSLPRGPELQYHWKQTFGADLDISAADLAKDRLCLIVKQPGEYRFELVASASGIYSKPVEVKVFIEDDRPAAAAVGRVANPPDAAPPQTAVAKTADRPPPVDEKQTPAAAAPPKPDPAKAKELHAQAIELMRCFKYADAKKLLHDVVALDPVDRTCQFDLGVALMECGELPAAISRFEDLAVSKNDAHAWMNIGHCHSRAGDLAGARQWYRRGAELAGDKVIWEPHWQLGNNALAKKDFKGALEMLERVEKDATAAKVKDYRLLRDLARALHGCKRDEEAMQKLVALQELGYTPEPQFVAEVKKGAEAARAAKQAAPAPPAAPAVAEATPTAKQKTDDTTQKPEVKKPVEPPPATVAMKTNDQKPEPATPKPEVKKPVEPPPATVATKTSDQKPVPAIPKAEVKKPVEPPPATAATKTSDQKPVETHVTVAAATISNENVESKSRKAEDKTRNPGTENPRPEPKVRKPVEDPNKAADVVDLANLDLTTPPKAATSKSSDAKPPVPDVKGTVAVAPVEKKAEDRNQKTDVRSPKPEEKGPKTGAKVEKTEVKSPKAEPKDQKPVETAGAPGTTETPKAAPKKTEPKPPPPKRALPPVPDDFDQALSAGKRAMAEGARLTALNTPESKQQAACFFEEAEAMLQGAWARKPGDETVMAVFKELSKPVGVVAIVRHPVIKSKVRGLVVLNAELSLSGSGKKLYYSWQQKSGEELNLRPEEMFQKVVGIRIYKAGMYKFELAVSDGGLGSNPVTVTVDVTE